MIPKTSRPALPHRRLISHFQLEIAYLALTLPTGLILILADKYPARPDEAAHWGRAFQIAHGQYLALPNPDGSGNYGGYIQTGVFENFNNTAINSPFVYLPSIFSNGNFKIASLLTLFFCSVLVTIAISLGKGFSPAIFAIAILPTFFLSIIWPTADAVTNSFSLLFISYILYLLQGNKYDKKAIVLLSILSFFLGLVKITCVLLLGLIFILMVRSFKYSKKYPIYLLLPVITGGVSFLYWSTRISQIPPSAVVTLEGYEAAKNSLFGRIPLLLRSLAISLFQPLDLTGDKYDTGRNIQFFTGSEVTQLPFVTMAPLLFAFALLIFISNRTILQSRLEKIVTGLLIIAFYSASLTGLILSWGGTHLGEYAFGIQSRYFIPIIPLLILLVPNFRFRQEQYLSVKRLTAILISWSYFGLICAHILY